jgi:hypothetical protein
MNEINNSKNLMRSFDKIQYFSKERYTRLTRNLINTLVQKVNTNILEVRFKYLREYAHGVKKLEEKQNLDFLEFLVTKFEKKSACLTKGSFDKLKSFEIYVPSVKYLEDQNNCYVKSIYNKFGKGIKNDKEAQKDKN